VKAGIPARQPGLASAGARLMRAFFGAETPTATDELSPRQRVQWSNG
jgi:hypothetical protein